jgi:tetratricopeptide (TPR) repeat protein
MKKTLILLGLCISFCISWSQTDVAIAIQEGIALHDQGNYEAAIEKYDIALKIDASSYKATYEKSLSLMSLKKYEEAEQLLRHVLKESKDPEYRRLAYVSYGTIKDFQGLPDKSIDIYNKGIKEFPESYLLHYNKGITLNGLGKKEESIASFKNSVRLNPYHASSHHAMAWLTSSENRIARLLALFTFLLIEPQSGRAKQNANELNRLLTQHISKNENGNVTINITMDMLDPKKNKGKEDDFSTAELMMALLFTDSKVEDSLGLKTAADKLGYKLQMIFSSISENNKKSRGFFSNLYVPMMMEMKERGFVTTACYIALQSTNDSEITTWLKDNPEKIDSFFGWFKNYQWTKASKG